MGELLSQHGAVVSIYINARVTHYVCDVHDTDEYQTSGASDLSIKRISEAYFLDSIKIGSLRLEKAYSVPVTAHINTKRPAAVAVVPKVAVAKPKKPSGPGLVRVDQFCALQEEARVYQSGGVNWSATLNQTNITMNNNKFYIIQLLQLDDGSYAIFNRWGRQGQGGQAKIFDGLSLPQAKSDFQKKFSDKTRNQWSAGHHAFVPVPGKYTWLDMDENGEHEDPEEPIEEAPSKPFKKGAISHASASSVSAYASSTRPSSTSAMDVDEPSSSSLTLAKPSSSTGTKAPCTLDPRVADLVQMIFDNSMMTKTVAAMNYDVKKQPLGKLSKLTIKKALGVLKEIEDLLTSGKSSQAKISDCSNRFYTLIPHVSGKMRLPYIDNLVILEEKLNLLETLNEIDAAAKLKKADDTTGDSHIHPLVRQYQQLNLELVPLDKNSELWATLAKWVAQTHAPTHTDYKLKILDIFEVDRPKDHAHFVPYEGLHNQALLWHGSRMSNWVGILSQGLRIAPPEAPVTGYMFGKGVYFADIVSKSANYCATSRSDNIGLLMACQVALGDTYDKTSAEFVKQLNPRFHSCKGVGLSEPDPRETVTLEDGVQVPLGKLVPTPGIDESDLLYNEFIVYDVAQIKFRYFFKFQFVYK